MFLPSPLINIHPGAFAYDGLFDGLRKNVSIRATATPGSEQEVFKQTYRAWLLVPPGTASQNAQSTQWGAWHKFAKVLTGFMVTFDTGTALEPFAGAVVTLGVLTAAGYQLVAGSPRAYQTGYEATEVAIADNAFAMPGVDVTVTADFEEIGAIGVDAVATDDFSVYPNPARTSFRAAGGDIRAVAFYNARGQLLRDIAVDGAEVVVDIADIAAGLCFVRVNGQRAACLVVMR